MSPYGGVQYLWTLEVEDDSYVYKEMEDFESIVTGGECKTLLNIIYFVLRLLLNFSCLKFVATNITSFVSQESSRRMA